MAKLGLDLGRVRTRTGPGPRPGPAGLGPGPCPGPGLDPDLDWHWVSRVINPPRKVQQNIASEIINSNHLPRFKINISEVPHLIIGGN